MIWRIFSRFHIASIDPLRMRLMRRFIKKVRIVNPPIELPAEFTISTSSGL